MASGSGYITRTLLLILVIAGVLAFLFPRNHPLLSWHAIRTGDFSSLERLQEQLPQSIPPGTAPVTAYRWQDKQGVWHLSSEAPPEGVEYQRISVDPDTNLISAPSDDAKGEKPLSARELLKQKPPEN